MIDFILTFTFTENIRSTYIHAMYYVVLDADSLFPVRK